MQLPPLVAPGPPLTGREAVRTARHALLPELGDIGQRRLAAARVLVMGAGGLGAPVLQYLAAAGIGTLAIVDDDRVELTNLHRQVVHDHAAQGEPKTSSAARALRRIAPDVTIVEMPERLEAHNAHRVLAGWDVVVDGTDTFATRYLVADTCAELGVPLVWGSVLRFDAQVCVFWSRPPAPALPVTLRDLFPAPPPPGSVPSCAEAGVLGALCGIAGSIMAVETIKLLTGIGEVLYGRLAVIEALTMRVAEVPFARTQAERSCPPPPTPPPVDLSPLDAAGLAALHNLGPVAVLDVREPGEFAMDALPGAHNVPLSSLTQSLRSGSHAVANLLSASGVPEGATLVAYCAHGVRSRQAVGALRGLGYPARVLDQAVVSAQRVATAAPGLAARAATQAQSKDGV